ncbi:hypothetical protein F0919_15295 [Taibaiella lutea]|uniref:Uncharacterized protein n=1 Tax=Taibaiella lutea TaxID=2608001 RepID=A0A5M6CAK9_9BACT|nr:hypothetical protein [Taibaiella lutea]KAA5532164.1 hypothetical protein F0919_15295 [Taibaiella lutea]
MKEAVLTSIDKKFEMSWKRLAKEPVKGKKGADAVMLQLSRLKKCLKWSTAYSILQNYCAKIIQPYHNSEATTIVKWFWVEYGEENFKKDIAPTPKEFFEWYCDSYTIQKEIENEQD